MCENTIRDVTLGQAPGMRVWGSIPHPDAENKNKKYETIFFKHCVHYLDDNDIIVGG